MKGSTQGAPTGASAPPGASDEASAGASAPQRKTRRISAQETLPLRHEILRPGRPLETAIFEGDDSEGTTHWAALDEGGGIVAVATLMRSPKPGSKLSGPSELAWQLRGMASAPSVRGQGYGATVLQAALDYVESCEPGALVWCNARTSALEFYQRQGFRTEGPEFEIAGVGPHFVMWRRSGDRA